MANPTPMEGAQQLQRMLVDYAKQETVEPLALLGKYLAFGLAGALCLFIGFSFLAMGALRFMQTSAGSTFEGGSWGSTVPYVVALFTLLLLIGIIITRFRKAKKRVLA